MTKLYAAILAYKTNEEGATAIEYGLIAAGIAVTVIAVAAASDSSSGTN